MDNLLKVRCKTHGTNRPLEASTMINNGYKEFSLEHLEDYTLSNLVLYLTNSQTNLID